MAYEIDPDPLFYTFNFERKYVWLTRGQNCALCNVMQGRVYTYDQWAAANVWPGFHPNCNCFLSPVADDTPVSDPDFFGQLLDFISETDTIFRTVPVPFTGSWLPYNVRLSRTLIAASAKFGDDVPIRQVIKYMFSHNRGYFLRESYYDEYYIQWRIYNTIQHMEFISGGQVGWFAKTLSNLEHILKPFERMIAPSVQYSGGHPYRDSHYATLGPMPDPLHPVYPINSWHTEVP